MTHQRIKYQPCNNTKSTACTSISIKDLISITWIMEILADISVCIFTFHDVTDNSISHIRKGKTNCRKLQDIYIDICCCSYNLKLQFKRSSYSKVSLWCLVIVNMILGYITYIWLSEITSGRNNLKNCHIIFQLY